MASWEEWEFCALSKLKWSVLPQDVGEGTFLSALFRLRLWIFFWARMSCLVCSWPTKIGFLLTKKYLYLFLLGLVWLKCHILPTTTHFHLCKPECYSLEVFHLTSQVLIALNGDASLKSYLGMCWFILLLCFYVLSLGMWKKLLFLSCSQFLIKTLFFNGSINRIH